MVSPRFLVYAHLVLLCQPSEKHVLCARILIKPLVDLNKFGGVVTLQEKVQTSTVAAPSHSLVLDMSGKEATNK